MINKIQCLLESIGYKGPSKSGELVLDLIENEGMLPPAYQVGPHIIQRYDYDRTPTHKEIYRWKRNKWEEE